MLGLLFKDFHIIKKNLRILALILVFYLVLGNLSDNYYIAYGFLMIFSATLPLSVISYDEKNHCDKLFLCMPITRKLFVSSYYVLAMILLAVSFILGTIISFVVGVNLNDGLTALALLSGLCIIFFSICFPFALTLGSDKSRYIMFALVLVPTILIALLDRTKVATSFFAWINSLAPVVLISALIGFGVICFVLSLFISIRLFAKKQL